MVGVAVSSVHVQINYDKHKNYMLHSFKTRHIIIKGSLEV